MSSRIRVFAALLALLSFSLSFAEGVAASLCPPGMEAGGMAAVETGRSAGHPGMHHATAPGPDDSDPSGSDAPQCPLGMGAPGSTCVSVSFPAAAAGIQPTAGSDEAALLFCEGTHDRLLVQAHFRPPRA
jgi:hypothetical protein